MRAHRQRVLVSGLDRTAYAVGPVVALVLRTVALTGTKDWGGCVVWTPLVPRSSELGFSRCLAVSLLVRSLLLSLALVVDLLEVL